MRKLAVLVLMVFLFGFSIPALAEDVKIFSSTGADLSETLISQEGQDNNVSEVDEDEGQQIDEDEEQQVDEDDVSTLPIDLNNLNNLSYTQLKQLKEQIDQLLEQKEQELEEFSGFIVSADDTSFTVEGKGGTKIFSLTPITELKLKPGKALQAGYKAKVTYDPESGEAIKVKAELVVLEDNGTLISGDSSTLTISGNKGEQKTYYLTEKTKIEGIGKGKSLTALKSGYKVGVKYTYGGKVLEIKILPGKQDKEPNKEANKKVKVREKIKD